MPRRLLSAAATCTLLLGLASCGEGGDGPVTTPPPEIDVSAPSDGGGDAGASDSGGDEADPSAAPDVPAPDPADYPGMDENTPEGAEQAFRYYMALMIWGYQTGNVDELDERSAESCNTCAHNRELIVENAKDGLYWSSAGIVDVGSKRYPSEEFDHEIGYVFYIGEHTEPDGGGGGVKEEPRTEHTAVGVMQWTHGGWSVVAIEIEKMGDSDEG